MFDLMFEVSFQDALNARSVLPALPWSQVHTCTGHDMDMRPSPWPRIDLTAERHLWLVPNMQRARCTGSWRGLRGLNWWISKAHQYKHEQWLKWNCKRWPNFIVTSGVSMWSCFGSTSSFTITLQKMVVETHHFEDRLWRLNQQPNQC